MLLNFAEFAEIRGNSRKFVEFIGILRISEVLRNCAKLRKSNQETRLDPKSWLSVKKVLAPGPSQQFSYLAPGVYGLDCYFVTYS